MLLRQYNLAVLNLYQPPPRFAISDPDNSISPVCPIGLYRIPQGCTVPPHGRSHVACCHGDGLSWMKV